MSTQAQPSVLLVEDEPLLRSITSEHLRDAGFQVMEAAAATEALALLDLHPEIAVLFTDVTMPGPLDGFDLACEVRRTRPRLHVIMTSGQWARRGAQVPEGAVFVQKPYSLDAIAKLMKALAKAT